MKSIRLYAASPLAAASTGGLFLVMQGLVGGEGEVKLDPVEPRRIIDVVQVQPPIIPDRKNWEVKRPEIIETKDIEVTPIDVDTRPTGPGIGFGPPKPTITNKPELIGLGAQADGDYLPIVRVQPQYPRRAQERGIEGYAIVELTVNADGSVPPDSVTVVETEPAGYFETNSIKAAQKFKYKPKVVNGIGQTVTGVRYKFSFFMDK